MAKKSNKRRSDGRIKVSVYLGVVDGKRKYKFVYGATQKEANEKALDIKLQLKKGLDLSTTDDTFGFWAQKWLLAKKNETSPAQYRAYKNRIGYFEEYFASGQIAKIKLYELQSVIDELAMMNPHTNKPTAKKTLGDIAGSAQQVYEYAIANRIVEYNPANQIKVPQNAPKTTRRAITKEERTMVENTPHRAQTPAMVMLYAGLRRGELAALTWSDIDFNKKTISINKAASYKESGIKIKQPKTKAGTRNIPMPAVLCDYLLTVPKTSLYVCPNKNGDIMSESAWQRLWRYYMNELNRQHGDFSKILNIGAYRKLPMLIEPFTMHSLRHTYCTLLYEAGIDVVVAMRLMGHSDVKTTLGVYTHLSDSHAEIESKKLDKFLSTGRVQVNEN